MTFPTWPNVTYVYVSDEDYATVKKVEMPAKTAPSIPWPCWDERSVDPAKAWEAVVSMSRGQ